MATQQRYPATELQRQAVSPRPKGRDNKDTLCRNILIYGHCRYKDSGCTFNHDQSKNSSNSTSDSPSSKKTLNVESPSFTPSSLQPQPAKKSTFSSQAASAAVFTPRGAGAATPSISEPDQPPFNPATIREFTPQGNYDLGNATAAAAPSDGSLSSFDPFSMNSVSQALPAAPFNPYANDHASLTGTAAAAAAAYYQGSTGFSAPVQPQYHLYFPPGPAPRPGDLAPYQRLAPDFFVPQELREDLEKKMHAARQIMSTFTMPSLDNYHSLVPLDTSQRKNASIFGYSSWVYKAVSTKTGAVYCLRRLENYRLTNEHAIRSVKDWKRIANGSVVSVHDAFTTRAFGDSSLVFAHDYYPLSQTLVEAHFTPQQPQKDHRLRGNALAKVPEATIWTYIVQISNAIKAIHAANLAVRCFDPSKIIVTDTKKGRVRLSACSILDVVHFEARRPVQDLQQEDFSLFGKLILCLATLKLPNNLHDYNTEVDILARHYSPELKDTVTWLLTPALPGNAPKHADDLIRGISHRLVDAFDTSLRSNDFLTTVLSNELANGRIARIMMKLATICERGEFDGDPLWSENGDRYQLKLFRDYVFHQVNEQGRPVVDMGHMINCLNKLDAGISEQVRLSGRDGETDFIITYTELKKMFDRSFAELIKYNNRA